MKDKVGTLLQKKKHTFLCDNGMYGFNVREKNFNIGTLGVRRETLGSASDNNKTKNTRLLTYMKVLFFLLLLPFFFLFLLRSTILTTPHHSVTPRSNTDFSGVTILFFIFVIFI